MRKGVFAGLALFAVLCLARPAEAITVEDIPERFYEILPKSVVMMIPKEILDRLTYEDVWEFIQAKDCGQLYRVNEVCVESWEGVRPEQIQGLLGVLQGFPMVPARFERAATEAYGKGIFEFLEWDIFDNGNGTVDVHLAYRTRRPSGWFPNVGRKTWAGSQLGASFNDFRLDGEDKRWGFGVLFNGEDTDELGGHVYYQDKTLDGGNNELYARLGLVNEYRERLNGLPVESRHRERQASLDFRYAWNEGPLVERRQSQWGLSGGVYVTDAFIKEGNPYAVGLPRADVSPEGTGAYAGIFWESKTEDKIVGPTEGWKYYFEVQQHFGEWNFNRVRADLRRYVPVDNVLGHEMECDVLGCEGNVAKHFPAASLAFQVQADVMGAHDVPYSHEVVVYDKEYIRGYDDESEVGTKFIGARAEYRFALDDERRYEGFVFSDQGWIGEDLDNLESLASYGGGVVFTPPVFTTARVSVHYGRGYTDETERIGFSFGYVF